MTECHRDKDGESSVIRIECRCGRTFYMAISTRAPALFSIAAGPGKAVAALLAKLARHKPLDEIEIPDCLPPEI